MKLQLIALACVAAVAVATDGDESNQPCFLLNGGKASKPFPSLTQCYKQNQQACCVSAHDQTIQNAYGNVLSGTCIREYADLEQYFCLGCSPNADTYINYYNATEADGSYVRWDQPNVPYTDAELLTKVAGDKTETDGAHAYNSPQVSTQFAKVNDKYGEIKLCKKFADRLMYDLQDSSTGTAGVIDAYDGCGLMLGPNDDDDDATGILSSMHFALDAKKDLVPGGTDKRMIKDVAAYTTEADGSAEVNGVQVGAFNRNKAGSELDKLRISPEWKFFEEMRPPYFESDKFEISWHHISTGQDPDICFGAASGVQVGSMAVALVALVAHMLA